MAAVRPIASTKYVGRHALRVQAHDSERPIAALQPYAALGALLRLEMVTTLLLLHSPRCCMPRVQNLTILDMKHTLASWRNGSASDSRSEGWGFESLTGH